MSVQNNPHIRSHSVAGTIHIVEVTADPDRLVPAIEFELDCCEAPALVIDITGDVRLNPGDAARLRQVLADPRLDGRWEINISSDVPPTTDDASPSPA